MRFAQLPWKRFACLLGAAGANGFGSSDEGRFSGTEALEESMSRTLWSDSYLERMHAFGTMTRISGTFLVSVNSSIGSTVHEMYP